ncbi:FecCD family ABC transporter permease [Pseudomonas chlororaphis]|uniref:ABC transporter permease n=1 Tax=Pseudomonas chlororaphis TaxID=587753 RepID=A0A1Q8ENT1_9PSED|nr:iron ABC transporter permease [Pseudomonas chlororaphis]OLF53439.1 ABC transporter permease [Pseudomonas chlororaphis]
MRLPAHSLASAGPTRVSRPRRRAWGLLAGTLLLALMALLSLAVGSRPIPLAATLDALQAMDLHNDEHLIVRELRLPRTLIGLLAGLALGVAGAVMQAVTRNPLAEPGLLGINAGAALAVIVGAAAFDLVNMLQYVWFAFAGAGLAGVAVFMLGQAHETGTNPVRLVLAGAGLSVMLASLTGIIVLNAPPEVFDKFRHWAAGSLAGSGFAALGVLAVAVGAGLLGAFSIAANLNALALGQDLGRALGVNVRLTWLLACLAVMLLAGAATAAAGPIGFVGLVAPHIARLLVGPDYRWLLPYSALLAAALLLGADVLGRVVAAPTEIAAGIVALLLGGPCFIALVRHLRLSRL